MYRVLILAKDTKDKQLLDFAMDYTAEHSDDILLSDDWQSFVEGGQLWSLK